MKTDDKTLIAALRILAHDINSGDGVANACIYEAANRLEELTRKQDDSLISFQDSMTKYNAENLKQ